jgi:iron(III) transport system ATP-binding protein
MLLESPLRARHWAARATPERDGLDPRVGGVTTILITHEQAEAMSFADQIVVLRGGVLRQAGPPGEVYRARSTARRRSSSATPSSSMP